MNIHEYQAKQLLKQYGVAVPAGRHRVTMEYVPRAFVAGVLISAGVLGVMLLAAARRW